MWCFKNIKHLNRLFYTFTILIFLSWPLNIIWNDNSVIYSCPMKTHPIQLRLKVAYQKLYYLYLLSRTYANISIRATSLTYDVTLAYTKKSQKSRSNRGFLFALVDQLTFRHKFDCCDATLNIILTRNISLYKRRNGLV